MNTFIETQFPFILSYDTGKKGPVIAIMGGMHGDEPCGVNTFHWMKEEFLSQYEPFCGKIYIILGNPLAVEKGKRFSDKDLNRLFNQEKIDPTVYESKRVEELKSVLQDVDYLLDIHSTSSESPSMTCSMGHKDDLELCSVLDIRYMTTGWEAQVEGMVSDEFVESSGGVGITLECGSHENKDAFDVARRNILIFLTVLEVLDSSLSSKKTIPKHVKIVETIYPLSKDFKFTFDLKNFTPISKGTFYAEDGNKKYEADDDYLIVMPAKKAQKGVEVGFLGEIA